MMDEKEMEARISYVAGYLDGLLGSVSIELTPAARKRIEFAIAVLKGQSETVQQVLQ